GDLARLDGDLLRRRMRFGIDPRGDGGGGDDRESDDRAPGPLAGERPGERLRGTERAEHHEQHVLEEEPRGDREHHGTEANQPGIRHGRNGSDWQASQDSNLEHAVLETAALPLELLAWAYFVSLCSVCLRQRGQNFGSTSLSVMVRLFLVVV